MQTVSVPNVGFRPWKTAKVREQLNKCLLKAGYAPCHLVYDRITVLRKSQKEAEEFYLDYGAPHQRFLFRAVLLFDENEAPFLLFRSFDHREVLHHFHAA